MPIGCQPRRIAAFATARITAFRPGQSPPPVTTPILGIMGVEYSGWGTANPCLHGGTIVGVWAARRTCQFFARPLSFLPVLVRPSTVLDLLITVPAKRGATTRAFKSESKMKFMVEFQFK